MKKLLILVLLLSASLAWAHGPTFTTDGDTKGPSSESGDNAIVRWDGTTGKLIQNSTATLDDSGNIVANAIKVGAGTVGSPGFKFNDGSGFFQPGDGQIGLVSFGTHRFTMTGSTLGSVSAIGGGFSRLTSTLTNPTLFPRIGDIDTGVGGLDPDTISLIAGSVEGVRVTKTGGNAVITFPDGYTRHRDILPGATTGNPTTAPSPVQIDTFVGLAFDADAEKSHFVFEVANDWDNVSDHTLVVHWIPEAGAALTDGQTVIWEAIYRSIGHGGEATDTGTAVTTTATYTQSGAGVNKESIDTSITIDFDNADQPLTAGDMVAIEFSRDMTGDTYGSDAAVVLWEIEHNATGMPEH